MTQQLRMFAEDSKVVRSAELSDDGVYRWWLRRKLPAGDGRSVCFIMLNPSTADALQDDPTIRRCIRFVRDWGFSLLVVKNLFPYRATDPHALRKVGWEVARGGDRGWQEIVACGQLDLIVCSWGASVPFSAEKSFLDYARDYPLWCLGTTRNGSPRHPLYVRADMPPMPYRNCCCGDWRFSRSIT